ncbi:MAG: radical SAM family RiPP maturation amino acid epimerase [Lachnospiraceae bacterium]|nr:radical SAM family RiPP maturation amino acid epimerase [Lachnospiraceae bacterium]
MTEHELSLTGKSINEMSAEDAERITDEVAYAKRMLDILSLIPGSLEEYLSDRQGFLDRHGIRLCREDIDFLCCPKDPDEKLAIISDNNRISEMPESFFRYRQFIGNKIAIRDLMTKKLCDPDNINMKKWRARQIRRCDGVLGGLNESFVHTVVTYELAEGCSVGCKFCGLSAGPLKKVFFHTPENSRLFKDVLKSCHKILGDAAGYGMMYFATEPLDNPDYEKFEDDFYEEFHTVPQITTAAADRDIERTRYFITEISKGRGFIHRFTIRSLEMAEKILESFTPRELVMVELLPQFPEAPAFVPYVKAGRETEESGIQKADGDPGTICCVDGFCISFPDKRFKLISPARADERFPKGIYESEWVEFENGADFEEKLLRYITDELELDIPDGKVLKMYDHFTLGEHNGKKCIISRFGEAIPLKEPYMVRIAELVKEGVHDRREIVDISVYEKLARPENAYWYLNRLWDAGCIAEKIFE